MIVLEVTQGTFFHRIVIWKKNSSVCVFVCRWISASVSAFILNAERFMFTFFMTCYFDFLNLTQERKGKRKRKKKDESA